MKHKKLLVLIFTCLLFLGGKTNAQVPLGLELNQDSFKSGDRVEIKAYLFNVFNSLFRGDLNVILVSSDEKFPVMPFHQKIILNPKEKKEIKIYSFELGGNFSEGEWKLSGVITTDGQKFWEDNKKFTVKGTLKEMEFTINVCKDEKCLEKPKLIFKSEKIYLNYLSNVSDLKITTTLLLPDQNKKSISLPTSIMVDQAGSYLIEATASKKGYEPANKKIELVVLEKEPEVIEASVCNGNSVCEIESEEDYQTCPQDCPLPEVKTAQEKKQRYFSIFGGMGVLLLLGAGIYFYYRKKWLSWKKYTIMRKE